MFVGNGQKLATYLAVFVGEGDEAGEVADAAFLVQALGELVRCVDFDPVTRARFFISGRACRSEAAVAARKDT